MYKQLEIKSNKNNKCIICCGRCKFLTILLLKMFCIKILSCRKNRIL